jgi:TolB-like protein/tetratricopeptide (TPR) repeat protein
MSLIAELKRRNVIKVAMLYGVAGWVILQIADILLPILGAPDWGMRLIFFLLLLGLPFALILAWKYELTPEGIRDTDEVLDPSDVTPATGRRIYVLIGVLAAVAVVLMAAGQALVPGWLADRPDGSGTSGLDTPPSEDIPEQSVGVLPFVNLGSDPADESISDGLSEELLNRLAAVDGLFVAARTSSFHFKDRTGDVVDVARELRVRHLLEGSVRRSGGRLRVTAQLIDATSGYHLWSETFDRPLDDIFAIEDEIAGRVTDALELKLTPSADAEPSPPTENTEAYLTFLEGRRQLAVGGIEGSRLAVEAFERAIVLDADYAEAYANLAIAWAQRGTAEAMSWHEFGPQVKAAADLALEHDDRLAVAWVADGLAKAYAGPWKLTDPSVRASMEKARAIAPYDSDVVRWYVQSHLWDRTSLEVMDVLQAALIRDRLSPQLHYALCQTYFQIHENDKAVESCLRAVEIVPGNTEILGMASWAALVANRLSDAVLLGARGIALDGDDPWPRCGMAHSYWEMGDFGRARVWLETGEQLDPDHICLRLMRAELHWSEGHFDAAAREAERFFTDGLAQQNEEMFSEMLLMLLLEYYLRRGEPEQAIAWVNGKREIVPEIDDDTSHRVVWRQFRLLPALMEVDPATARHLLAQYDAYTTRPHPQLDYLKRIIMNCRLHAYQGRADQAVEQCRRQRSKHAPIRDQLKLSMFDPVKSAPEWQAFIAEIEADRAAQLTTLRASGNEPDPGDFTKGLVQRK